MRKPTGDQSDILSYFVNRGVLTDKQADEARRQAARRRPRVGQILVQEGILTVKQVAEILRVQSDTRDCFGEIGIERGMLTPVSLIWALEEQYQRTPHPLEIIREFDLAPDVRILDELPAYLNAVERKGKQPTSKSDSRAA